MGSGHFLARPHVSVHIPDSVSQKARVYVYLEAGGRYVREGGGGGGGGGGWNDPKMSAVRSFLWLLGAGRAGPGSAEEHPCPPQTH